MILLARLLNLAFLVLVVVAVVWIVAEGDDLYGVAWLFVALLLVFPMINLLALSFRGGSDWLSLYLRRKAAEERKRLQDLERAEETPPDA